MNVELPSDLRTTLMGLQTSLSELRGEVAALYAELRSRPAQGNLAPRKWYSVEEAAGLLDKRPYTVREWCRHGQINAVKRSERRGGAALWSISAEEVERYTNEGLLRPDPDRNNLN